MPLTLTLTEGVLPVGTERKAVEEITNSFLKHHGLEGNKVMTPNVTAHVNVMKYGTTFSGGKEFSGAWIEWKTPSFAFASREIQKAVCDDSVAIIQKLSGGKQPKDNIYFNVTHTVPGSWAMNGIAMTNEELGTEISKG